MTSGSGDDGYWIATVDEDDTILALAHYYH